jgi:hypothetical protein
MKQIEELVKGDIIKIQYANGIHRAIVRSNSKEERKMLLDVKVCWLSWVFGGCLDVKGYDDYNFYHYEILNS